VIAKWALSCFVIGDDKKRKIVVLPNLHKFGFKPKIIAPNFFDKWPVNFSRERSLALTRRSLSLGELGCAQSHLDCYKTFLDSNSHLTLIFEDDAFLSDQKLNEFNTRDKYFYNNTSNTPNTGINKIKTWVNPTINNLSTAYLDQVVVVADMVGVMEGVEIVIGLDAKGIIVGVLLKHEDEPVGAN
jgi:hypothetical protein